MDKRDRERRREYTVGDTSSAWVCKKVRLLLWRLTGTVFSLPIFWSFAW
ncbi:MAG: hypothetical protein AAGC71_07065 [Pseudomonadota bacterium]